MKRKKGKKIDKKILLFLAIFGIILATSMFTTYAVFSGSHSVYKNTTPATAVDFCNKCHPDRASSLGAGVHASAGCICHGYAPNATELYNINIAHNLTKNVYCTNCHSNYTIATGNITIHSDAGRGDISGINQSAHYIINSSTNRTPVYDRARSFFNGS